VGRPRIAPQRWVAPAEPPAAGLLARTALPHRLELFPLPAEGPEDVLVDPDGSWWAGTADGTIWRCAEDRLTVPFASTGGRPLGLEHHPDGWIVVCDAHRGLLRLDPRDGRVDTLADGDGQAPFRFTNNAAVAADGSIYFSDSSQRFGLEHFKADLLEHSGTGRIFVRRPSGILELLLTGLDFPNGVALTADESALWFVETAAYRIRRLWLAGPRAGTVETLVANLPGLPDNLNRGASGLFWVALPSERNALLDRLLQLPGLLRKAVWALPEPLQPDASRVLFVLGYDDAGELRAAVRAPGDAYHYVTSAREHGGSLYLGSLVESSVLRIPAPL
jgi:sugar lactone lactonase YvrE